MFGLGGIEIIILAVLFIPGLAIYFLPGIIAAAKKHPRALAISVTNIFVGWTVVGWVACMIWALSGGGPLTFLQAQAPAATRACLRCGLNNPVTARFCSGCGSPLAGGDGSTVS